MMMVLMMTMIHDHGQDHDHDHDGDDDKKEEEDRRTAKGSSKFVAQAPHGSYHPPGDRSESSDRSTQ